MENSEDPSGGYNSADHTRDFSPDPSGGCNREFSSADRARDFSPDHSGDRAYSGSQK